MSVSICVCVYAYVYIYVCVCTRSRQLALEAAHQSIVLLKNDGKLLPLRRGPGSPPGVANDSPRGVASDSTLGVASASPLRVAFLGPHANATQVWPECVNG